MTFVQVFTITTRYLFAILGLVIEKLGGLDAVPGWSDFFRRRIFDPLPMHRSTTNRKKLIDDNIAQPYVVLDNRTPKKSTPSDMADDTALGGAGSVWSSVPDMLKWATAILNGLVVNPNATASETGAPLRQLQSITAHRAFVTTSSLNENTYALGWARSVLPSTELRNASGATLSINICCY
jgi:CubicO group peptidase (beta-lactamase class C family)